MAILDGASEIRNALARGTRHALRHMQEADAIGLAWHEATITDLFLVKLATHVHLATFSTRDEATTGADWIWWWIDSRGEAYGMLVQAKRLKISDAGKWSIDVGYKEGSQTRALLESAETLGLSACYSLYFGTREYRENEPCGHLHRARCGNCSRQAVSVLPGVVAESLSRGEPDVDARQLLRESIAIEELPPTPSSEEEEGVWVVGGLGVSDELRAFFLEPQTGARAIARSISQIAARARAGSFSNLQTAVVDAPPATEVVFPNPPNDRGHFVEPWMPSTLRGLYKRPPAYVEEILLGQAASELPNTIAGVAIVHVDD